jgi:hypothetical protein
MQKYIYIFILSFALVTCKKNDVSKNVTITGNVRNNCTGTGFANVTVQLIMTFEKSSGKKEITTIETACNYNGDFSFITDIQKSDKYA